MEQPLNRQVRLVRRPVGIPEAEDFKIDEKPAGMPGPGQVRVRNVYLSVEPAMRGWVSAVANYAEPVALGSVMRSFTAGRIDASSNSAFPVGTLVTGMFGWQDYTVVDASAIQHVIEATDLPLSTSLGVMGINGVTAHYGLLELGRPRQAETVVVSTAAGSVGSCVGQIARIRGCRTVGITGGPAKVAQCLETFGYSAAVDYTRLCAPIGCGLPTGRGHLLRQHGGRYQRRGDEAPAPGRARSHLRHGLSCQLGPGSRRPARGAALTCQARQHAGLRDLRPPGPLPRGPQGLGAVDTLGRVAL